MEIKWPNVVALGLILLAGVLVFRSHHEIGIALTGIGQIGPGHTAQEKFHGFFVLGIICVAAVAIVRLVLDNHNRKDK